MLMLCVLYNSVDLEQKEYEASLQVRDSVQLVENAILERDQVLNIDDYLFSTVVVLNINQLDTQG